MPRQNIIKNTPIFQEVDDAMNRLERHHRSQQQVSQVQDSTHNVQSRFLKKLQPPGVECGEEETLQCKCKKDNNLFNNGNGNGKKVPTSSPITVCNGECYKYNDISRALTIDTSSNDVCEPDAFCVEAVVTPSSSPTQIPTQAPTSQVSKQYVVSNSHSHTTQLNCSSLSLSSLQPTSNPSQAPSKAPSVSVI